MDLSAHSFEKDEKTFIVVPLSLRQVYEEQLKLKKKGGAKSTKQPCEIVRKSENNKSIDGIHLTKVKKNRDSAKRGEKKRGQNKKKVRK